MGLPMAGKRHPTAGQVARAKAQAVGGGRKRCKRGKNCSAACIQAAMTCLVEFPAPVSSGVAQLRDYVRQKNNVQPGSIQDKRLNLALGKLAEVVKVGESTPPPKRGGLAKPSVEVKSQTARANRKGVTWGEVQGLKKRRDMLSDAEVQKEAMRALHKDAMTRGLRLPRRELEMIYELLPKNVQESLARSGKPGKGGWYAGTDENGKPIFSSRGGKERALTVLDMWFRQGGTDAYQSKGSRVWAPTDLSVEHLVPLSKGGIDAPSNWVLIRRGTNLARQEKRLGSWIDSLPSSREGYKTYLSKYAKDRRAGQARKARMALVDPTKMSDGDIFNSGNKKLAGIFRGQNGGKSASLFTKEWLGIKTSAAGGRTGNSGPPGPFSQALGLVAKHGGLPQARTVGNKMKNIWNNDWKRDGNLTGPQAYKQMLSEMKSVLTPEQYNNLFLPAAQAWASSNGFL
jgi:hypothetical protein